MQQAALSGRLLSQTRVDGLSLKHYDKLKGCNPPDRGKILSVVGEHSRANLAAGKSNQTVINEATALFQIVSETPP